jgi:hypothetical protein
MAREILTSARMYANGEMFAIVDGTEDEIRQIAQQFKNTYASDHIKVSHGKLNFTLTKTTATKGAYQPQRQPHTPAPAPIRRPNIARQSH